MCRQNAKRCDQNEQKNNFKQRGKEKDREREKKKKTDVGIKRKLQGGRARKKNRE